MAVAKRRHPAAALTEQSGVRVACIANPSMTDCDSAGRGSKMQPAACGASEQVGGLRAVA